MKTEQFVNLVKEMREAQKTFFKLRHYPQLIKAQDLERRVDKAIKEIESSQQSLFD